MSGRKILPKIVALSGTQNPDMGGQLISNYLAKKYLYKKIQFTDTLEDVASKMLACKECHRCDLIRDLLPGLPYADKFSLAKTLINRINNDNYKYVITDLRHISQYNALKKTDVFVVKVDDDKSNSEIIDEIPYDMLMIFNGNIPAFIKEFDKTFMKF